MFKKIDLSLLNDPEFKEDSVREELVAPLLWEIGYSASGLNKIIRSRTLTHPYVLIGVAKKKIHIIPDYILEVEGKTLVTIDAKSPTEKIDKSKHVEQAYSYAIHPEVRAKIYGLCNGLEWIFWHVSSSEPILRITTKKLMDDIKEIKNLLDPNTLKFYKINIEWANIAKALCEDITNDHRQFSRHFGVKLYENKTLLFGNNGFDIKDNSSDRDKVYLKTIQTILEKIKPILVREKTSILAFEKSDNGRTWGLMIDSSESSLWFCLFNRLWLDAFTKE